MRKNFKMACLACLGLALSTSNINAQTVSDFESQTLSTNSSWDGSDMSGTHNVGVFTSTFTDGDAIFPNVYDTVYGAAYGYMIQGSFGYSNKEDSITSGEGFSSYAYGAAMGDNYAIGKNKSTIRLTGTTIGTSLTGMYVTNSTYTGISMRDGDAYGKVFGDSLSAAGHGSVSDGSNGKDYLLLTAQGYTGGNPTANKVEFYLADYRFTNNSQDYIINTWKWVDLSTLGNVDSVQFFLTSTDTTGGFGMNTPNFFCFDDFNGTAPTSINEFSNTNKISIYPNPATNTLNIDNDITVTKVSIFDVTGKVVMNASDNQLDISKLSTGVHFLRIETEEAIYKEKFIKQ